MTSFPGSPVEQFALTDTGCGPATGDRCPRMRRPLYFVAFGGSDLFVGGQFDDDTVYGGRASGGVLQWAVGNAEVGGPGWIGWVHGLVLMQRRTPTCSTPTRTSWWCSTPPAPCAPVTVSELIGSLHVLPDPRGGPRWRRVPAGHRRRARRRRRRRRGQLHVGRGSRSPADRRLDSPPPSAQQMAGWTTSTS
ncbi:MAG: hypothetical protein R2713_01170 [Ilumatobacteraceae bacterium]